jgi:hypothetical protein
MNSVGSSNRKNRVFSALRLLIYLFLAVVLVIIAHEAIDIIDEGLMHKMTIFESEPKEGWDYWKWKAIKEALPSWIICGTAWITVTGFILYLAYRNAKTVFFRKMQA